MKRSAIIPLLTLFVCLCGCTGGSPVKPQDAPGGPGSELTIEERLQRREAVEKLQKAQLEERIKQDRAVKRICGDDQKHAEKELREQKLASLRAWCWWVGVGALVLAVVAGALILKFTGRLKLALSVAAGLAALGLLSFGLGWVLANLTVVILIAAGVVVLGVIYRVWEHIDALKDFARIAASKVKDADAVVEELAKAKVHNVETFKAELAKLKE